MAGAAAACCILSDSGSGFDGQKSVIIWDPDTQVQHFIRQADFTTSDPEAAWLAPTPSRPELALADAAIFDLAHQLVKPPLSGPTGGALAAPAGLEVIEKRQLGAYDIAVLRGTEPAAISEWLSGHGFKTSSGVENWLKNYAHGDWHITAFKLTADPARNMKQEPVRMSFVTDRPFHPYIVPTDNISASRHSMNGLQLSVITPQPMSGSIAELKAGESASMGPEAMRQMEQRAGVSLRSLGPAPVITAFADYGFPRAVEDDLWFSPSGAWKPPLKDVAPLPYSPPMGPLLGVLAGVAALGWAAMLGAKGR